MQRVLDRRGALKGSPRTLDKMNNKAEIGEGSKQIRKSREDARPYKFMRRNDRQLAFTFLGIVISHIFSKPHKECDLVHIIKY
jgi:hypothetical protein